jgi:uncharacterized protein YgiM (DUF1202 family)
MRMNFGTCVALVVGMTLAPFASSASGQQGQQGTGQQAPGQQAPAEPASGRVRVPTRGANVHMGPTTGQQLLVVVPKGTVLNVTGRDKEWIQVELTEDLRKTAMVVRWYKNETRGWMHDSTVEFLDPTSPRVPPR